MPYNTSTTRLAAKAKKNAWRSGMAWDSNDITVLVAGIEKDKTTFEMAMDLNRPLYGTAAMRRAVGIAMRFQTIIMGHYPPPKKAATKRTPAKKEPARAKR